MVTDTAHDAAKITRFFGLSTATKPASAMIGATFLETDTRRAFVYDGAEWGRDHTVTAVQAGPVIVTEVLGTDDLLSQILVELKINNAHLAIITGDEINEEDLENAGD